MIRMSGKIVLFTLAMLLMNNGYTATAVTAPTTKTAVVSTPAPADKSADNIKLPQTLKLAGETWKLGFHEENAKFDTAEYVMDDQTVQNWQQMFTFQKFKTEFPGDVLLVTFADQQIAELKKRGYDIKYTVHSSSADEAIIEFQVNNPVDQQQDEIQRLIKFGKQFYIFHYVSKKMDMGEAERNKWIAALKGLQVSKFS